MAKSRSDRKTVERALKFAGDEPQADPFPSLRRSGFVLASPKVAVPKGAR